MFVARKVLSTILCSNKCNQGMREIFIGVPTKEEIVLYLRQRSHSLLNMLDLRSDILRKDTEETEKLYKNFFQENFSEAKRSVLSERTNRAIKPLYKRKTPMLCAEQKNVECVDIAKTSNRTLKKLTQKNTQKNTGYRRVKLQYKNKRTFFGEPPEKREEGTRKQYHIKWVSTHALDTHPHNLLSVKPILKSQNDKPAKEIKVRKKVKISIEAKVIFSNFDADSEFKYTVSRY